MFLASRPQHEAADKLSLLYVFGVSIDEFIFVFGRVLKTLRITAHLVFAMTFRKQKTFAHNKKKRTQFEDPPKDKNRFINRNTKNIE